MNWNKFLIATLFLFPSFVLAQLPDPKILNVKDTLNPEHLLLDEIPAYSLQTFIKLDKIAGSLIDEDEIGNTKATTDSILSYIELMLSGDKMLKLDSLLSRKLVDMSRYWNQNKEILEKQSGKIESVISGLIAQNKQVQNELYIWKNTLQLTDTSSVGRMHYLTALEVIHKGDSVSGIISSRVNSLYPVLRKLNRYLFEVNNILINIQKIIRYRQEKVLEKTNPSFRDFTKSGLPDWKVIENLKSFIKENAIVLSGFYKNNVSGIMLYAFYLLLLIVFFYFLMRKRGVIIKQADNFYLQSLSVILRRPVSVALILGVFTSGLFLRNRPPILIDIFILINTAAIIDVMAQLAHKKGKIFLSVFAILILFRFINYIFPPDTPIHRLNLLLMGVLEIIILWLLYRKLHIERLINSAFNRFVKIIILLHLVAAVIGLIADGTGQLRLAEIAIDLAITNTLVGLLLIFSSIVLIGLFQVVIDGSLAGKFGFVRKRRDLFKSRSVIIVLLIASFLWINYILEILRINDIFYQYAGAFLKAEISLGSTSFTLGSVLLFFFIIYVSVIVSNMIKAVLEDDVLQRIALKKGVPRIISVIVRFSLITIGFLLAISAIGMPLNQLTIIVSAFSVGIGFGLQNIVNNFVSGIVLLFERPIQIGDTVEVNNLMGMVKSMGIRSSNIRTFDGAEVIVPNANLISSELINWTLSDKKRRIEIFSGVAYGSDVHKVKEVLTGVLQQHPDILKEPEPMVLFNNLGESSLDFRLLFWIDNFEKWLVIKSEVIFMIHDALKDAGITIPFPQRDLHINLKNMDYINFKNTDKNE